MKHLAARRDAAPFAFFILLTLVMTNPLALHLATAVEDKQDALLNTWIIAWVGHALTTSPLHLFDANIFYPYANTLAFSEVLLPQGLLALPINLAFANTVLGYNLVLLFSFLLAAYGMYLFVLDLTRHRGAALVAGTIFAFNPYNLGNLAQIQLLSFGWLPLALLFLRRMLGRSRVNSPFGQSTVNSDPSSIDREQVAVSGRGSSPAGAPVVARSALGDEATFRMDGRRHVQGKIASQPRSGTRGGRALAMTAAAPPSSLARAPANSLLSTLGGYRDVALFALFFSLQVLSSIYYAFLAGIAVALYVIWFFITEHVTRNTHYALRFAFYASRLARLTLAAAIIAILVVPVLLPYLQVQRELGFQRNLQENEQFSASFKLYAEVSPQNVVYGNLLAPRPPIMAGGYPLDNLFPGILAVILAIVGLTSKHRAKWFYVGLLLFAFVLSLGPQLYLAPGVETSLALPYRWLYDALPFTHALRAPVRFDALVMFALAILAGLGAQKAVGKMSKRSEDPAFSSGTEGSKRKAANGLLPSAYCLLPTAFCLLLSLEYLAVPAASITPVPVGGAVPEYVHWLAQQPHGVVLELPMLNADPSKPLDLTTQYLSTYHWQNTPDGYSGFNPGKRGEIAYEMQSFPNERSVSLLQSLGVQYVVLHHKTATPTFDLQLVRQFGNDSIYRVTPRTLDPLTLAMTLEASIYCPQPAAPGQNYTAYVIIKNRGERSLAVKPTAQVQVNWQFNSNPLDPQRSSAGQAAVRFPLVTTTASVVPVQLPAPRQPGDYRLLISFRANNLFYWDLGGDIHVANEEPSHQVVLPASVTLDKPMSTSFAPGASVDIPLTWHPLNKIDEYYSASVRIVDSHGNKVTNLDREPAVETMLWTPGVPVPDHFDLTLPHDLAPGEYSIQLLMYHPDPWVDALLLDDKLVPQDKIVLGTFGVK